MPSCEELLKLLETGTLNCHDPETIRRTAMCKVLASPPPADPAAAVREALNEEVAARCSVPAPELVSVCALKGAQGELVPLGASFKDGVDICYENSCQKLQDTEGRGT